MRILIFSHLFHPSIGGSETAAMLLANGFVERGHQVTVVTQTAHTQPDDVPFRIIRQPGHWELFRAVRWCDAYLQSNMSLRAGWPLLALNRPWLVIHHTRITRVDGTVGWKDRAKRFFTRFATNLSVSHSMARELPGPSLVLGNAYDDATFRLLPEVPRERDIVFLGRLNYDKGAHLVVDAVAELKRRGRTARLTVIGPGTEEHNLLRRAQECGVADLVTFAGKKTGRELARLLNAHKVHVVPSIVHETFGIVVLEGIACGCAVVVADNGGLVESAGPCGLKFPIGSVPALTDALEKLLAEPALTARLQTGAPAHLARFTRASIIDSYLRVLASAVARRASARRLAPAA
ncbi:MAG: glycosyltransferase family 4 protein [Verrucomicrobia bacterium]|nr:glycosyltransferase family 4 protein [Verrucomicrobiota bacterium]